VTNNARAVAGAGAPMTSEASPIAAFEAALAAAATATGLLQRLCGETPVRAEVDRDASAPAGADSLARLGVANESALGYRRVRLMAGARLLSVAENWFVPVRLTPAMCDALETGDKPFGAVIAPLAPRRLPLSVQRLWGGRGDPPDALLSVRAMIVSGAGMPLAIVSERYQRGVLG
jgi:hypothetical protein